MPRLRFYQRVITFALIITTASVFPQNPVVSGIDGASQPDGNIVAPKPIARARMTSALTPDFTVTSGITAISVGEFHSCALTGTGSVKCWGSNDNGQLGDGTTTRRLVPVTVSGLTSGVAAIAAGGEHTCALTSAGGVKCWGNNSLGQLGDGTVINRLTPVSVSGLTSGVVAIATGGSHTCALTSAGGVKCWGSNFNGELGDGTWDPFWRPTPVNVTGFASGAVAIAAGSGHTCAVTSAGGVKCWGLNGVGELGDGTLTDRNTPVNVSGLASGAMAIVVGNQFTCALTSAGGAKCWGKNTDGQLGDGTTAYNRLTPVNVSGLTSGVTAITAGQGHTCALTSAGGIKCWGGNSSGKLGDGTITTRLTPVDVIGLTSSVMAIAAGGSHTCALTDVGGVKCWGDTKYGQLGDGTATAPIRTVPGDVIGLTTGVSVMAAGGGHTCALTSAGGIKCWGQNGNGKLGDGTTTDRFTPVSVSGLTSGAVAIAASGEHTCAVTGAGGVKCWGWNFFGQLGDGTKTIRLTPVNVNGLHSGVTAVVAGGFHTCALTNASGVKCWGSNYLGQLGDGTTTSRLTPVNVSGLTSGVTAITAGEDHTCALTGTGGIKCWGWNFFGQLGDGTTTDRLTPVDVNGLTSGVIAIAAGGRHTCALTSAGGVKCWGSNLYGQLGDDTGATRLLPVDVNGLTSGVIKITASQGHTCAMTSTGGLRCWGYNGAGQLGDGTTIDRPTPVEVSGFSSGATSIAAGGRHSCALTSVGGVKCWGDNYSGQLGDGIPWYRSTPTDVVGLDTYYIAGQVRDSSNIPVAGVTISTTLGAAITDASGIYTITDLANGYYTITPIGDYTFLPTSRAVSVPPSAPGQDFVAYTVFKQGTPGNGRVVEFGDALTYTLNIITPGSNTLVLHDRVPTYTSYISGSLNGPPGITYDSVANAISGTLNLANSIPLTVSFAVRVEVTGTADFAPLITNRACVYSIGGELANCLWSNELWNFTFAWTNYLPIVLRNY